MRVYRLERNNIGPCMGLAKGWNTSKSKPKAKRSTHVQSQCRVKDWVKYLEAHHKAVENNFLFGASSKERLKAYFGFNLQPFFKQGYRIKSYEVPDKEVIDMGIEVAFPPQYHKLRTAKNVIKAVGYL